MLGLGHGIHANSIVVAGVAIEDYMWELDGAGSLKPLASGTVSDFHDTWDLDGTDYTPQDSSSHGDEGYWELEGTNIKPLDV